MNSSLWFARKNYLYSLIRRISYGYGGDDNTFLDKHCQETIANHPDEKIEEAIACYEGLIESLKYKRKEAK